MLRLRVAASLPWVDSRNIIRSPVEQFAMLEDEARRAILGESRPPLIWEFGVLTDSWERAESSKPLLVGAEDDPDSSIACYAVGNEAAREYHEELRPLWLAFLKWMSERHPTDVYFFSDEFWSESHGWSEFDEASRRRLVSGVTALTGTSAAGVYAAVAHQVSIDALLNTWWPSGLGMLGGSSLKRGPNQQDLTDSLLSRGRIAVADLARINRCFQTAASFDNLGFLIMNWSDQWSELRAALAREGWVDGLPVDLALARLQEKRFK